MIVDIENLQTLKFSMSSTVEFLQTIVNILIKLNVENGRLGNFSGKSNIQVNTNIEYT